MRVSAAVVREPRTGLEAPIIAERRERVGGTCPTRAEVHDRSRAVRAKPADGILGA
jgi:hypothetical protein